VEDFVFKIYILIAVKWLYSLSENTKIDVSWESAPDLTTGPYSDSQTPMAGFKGAASRHEGMQGTANFLMKL